MAQGRAAEAIACYEQVALLHPDSPDAHANLASSYKDAARQARPARASVHARALNGGARSSFPLRLAMNSIISASDDQGMLINATNKNTQFVKDCMVLCSQARSSISSCASPL